MKIIIILNWVNIDNLKELNTLKISQNVIFIQNKRYKYQMKIISFFHLFDLNEI